MNKLKGIFLTAALPLCGATALAVAPLGYYTSLEGKKGAELRKAVSAICGKSFTKIEYGSDEGGSWDAFKRTDVRTFQGKQIWRDMYSNNAVFVESGHAALNIEHCVAKSWWTGTGAYSGVEYTTAYSDLHHLNPSDAVANNKKSNYIIAPVGNASWTNGLVKLGAPAAGYGGSQTTVFEPADEYKGDFARAYFYMFTIDRSNLQLNDSTPDANSQWNDTKQIKDLVNFPVAAEGVTFQPWFAKMLLEWNAADPVDAEEMHRNDEVNAVQGNRNPYIDCPALAEYIFGDKGDAAFSYAAVEVVDRPAAPVVKGFQATGWNQYVGDWWEPAKVEVEGVSAPLYVSLNGADWQQFGSSVDIPAATTHGQEYTVRMYTEKTLGDRVLKSAITTLTLNGKNPELKDYTKARWELVSTTAMVEKGKQYILLSSKLKKPMGWGVVGTALKDEDAVTFTGDFVTNIPVGSAILEFEDAADAGSYLIKVTDFSGTPKGYLTTTAAKQLKIGATGTPATIEVNADLQAIIDLGKNASGAAVGNILYNASSPRFACYTSAQEPVLLYRITKADVSTNLDMVDVDMTVAVSGRDILAPAGSRIFSIGGAAVSGKSLPSGLYIVLLPNGKVVKLAM